MCLPSNTLNTPPLHTLCLVRGSKTIKTVQLTENEVRNLCLKSSEIFLSQPILLELEAPLKICGEWPVLRCVCPLCLCGHGTCTALYLSAT